MSGRKLSVDEQKELIPDDSIHQAFLEREDIACLPPDEQEKRWQKQLEGINRFRDLLSGLDSFIVG